MALPKPGKYVNGKPPPGVTESRTFGDVLCFRATCCDFCKRAPHHACKHYPAMRDRVNDEGMFQCPEYLPAALG